MHKHHFVSPCLPLHSPQGDLMETLGHYKAGISIIITCKMSHVYDIRHSKLDNHYPDYTFIPKIQ